MSLTGSQRRAHGAFACVMLIAAPALAQEMPPPKPTAPVPAAARPAIRPAARPAQRSQPPTAAPAAAEAERAERVAAEARRRCAGECRERLRVEIGCIPGTCEDKQVACVQACVNPGLAIAAPGPVYADPAQLPLGAGILMVSTSAPGAELWVDGARVGSIVRRRDVVLPAGLHAVRVEAPGLSPFSARIDVGAQRTVGVEAVLR